MLALCPAGDEIVFALGYFMGCEKRSQMACASIVTSRSGYPAAAHNHIPVVEHDRLTGRDGTLRFVECR